jgi:hypothetical protein
MQELCSAGMFQHHRDIMRNTNTQQQRAQQIGTKKVRTQNTREFESTTKREALVCVCGCVCVVCVHLRGQAHSNTVANLNARRSRAVS